jgi:hypothetical protein
MVRVLEPILSPTPSPAPPSSCVRWNREVKVALIIK